VDFPLRGAGNVHSEIITSSSGADPTSLGFNMPRITLYQFNSDFISIDIQAYFQEENLVIEGYDIGQNVKDYWGDGDYEYSTLISPLEVKKLYTLMEVREGDKEGLLQRIAEKFNSNTCTSEWIDYLDKNGIASSGSSWI
jgi:hypothetical protein